MSKKKWTAAQRRKFKATMRAKRAQQGLGVKTAEGWEGDPPKPGRRKKMFKRKPGLSPVGDAIIYLTHAREAILAEVRGGRKALMTRPEMYAMLALDTLEGVAP